MPKSFQEANRVSVALSRRIAAYRRTRKALDEAYASTDTKEFEARMAAIKDFRERDAIYDAIVDPADEAMDKALDAVRDFKPRSWADFAAKAMVIARESIVITGPQLLDPDAEAFALVMQDIHDITGLEPPCPPADLESPKHSGYWWPKD